MNILIVDDNDQSLYLLRAVLEGAGHQTTPAADGAEAFTLALKQRPDAVITDILMPKMDGFAFCRAVRSHETLRDVPVLLYSATYTDAKDRELGLALGADRFLEKPMEPADLLIELETAVQERKDGKPAHRGDTLGEPEFLREYNERLVRKLEDRMAAHLKESARVAWHDRSFRALFGTRVALAGAAMATPFFVLYAVRDLGLSAALVAGFLSAKIAGYVLSNILWQRVATRFGNRALMSAVGLIAGLAPLCALFAGIVPAPLKGPLIALAFALFGAVVSGNNIGYQSLLLAIAPAARRPSYVGLMNSFVGPAMLLPALGGILVDATSPLAIFAVAASCGAGAFGLARRLPGAAALEARLGPDATS